MRTPSLQQFTRWAKDHYELAHAVCMAQAYAQCKREQVDAYIKPVFDLFDFYPSADMLAHGAKNERIADPKHLYMTDLDGAEYKRFIEECDVEHRKHGFDGPHGYCPALMADSLRIKAENALLAVGGELFGVDLIATSLENRAKALDLLLGACLKREAA